MPRLKALAMLIVWIALATGVASLGSAGEQWPAILKQYWGQITSLRIDRCGKRPGLCAGVIIVAQRDGRQVALAIRPGTWIKRGDRLVLLEELSVGNGIHVQAVEIALEGILQATTIDVSTHP